MREAGEDEEAVVKEEAEAEEEAVDGGGEVHPRAHIQFAILINSYIVNHMNIMIISSTNKI